MIHLKNIVTELSDNYTKQTLANVFQVPDKMPEYVFDDFIMSPNGFFSKELDRILKNNPDADEDDIAFEFEDWVDINWRLKVLKLNLSDFTKDNQKTMIQRKFGDANPWQKLNATSRHEEFQVAIEGYIEPCACTPKF